MSIQDDAETGRTSSRTSVFLLTNVLNQASDPRALRNVILEGVSNKTYRLYWPVPADRIAFSRSNDRSDPHYRKPMSFWDERNPEAWTRRPDVKFVGLLPNLAQHFLEITSIFQHPVFELNFEGGLFIPDDLSVSSQLFEATEFTTQLRLSHPDRLDRVTDQGTPSSMVEIKFHELYLDENTLNHVRGYLQDLPSASAATSTATSPTHTEAPPEITEPAATAAAVAGTTPPTTLTEESAHNARTDDPYELKGRSDAVYVLYLTAARCAHNQAFKEELNPKKRRVIAKSVFDELLNEMMNGSDEERALQKRLRTLFGKIRLRSALILIDPEYSPNAGQDEKNWVDDWPPAQGKAFLAEPDQRRQPFVTDMLRLIICGVDQWLSLKTTPPPDGGTQQEALGQWLVAHGVIRTQGFRTAFAVITGSDSSIPSLPKYAAR